MATCWRGEGANAGSLLPSREGCEGEEDDSSTWMLMLCVCCVALAMSVTRATIWEARGGVKGVGRPATRTYDN